MNALTDYINQASLIIKVIKENKKNIFDSEIDNEFFQKFETTLNELKNLDEEQETLKVKFKSKTAQVDEKIDDLNKFMNQAKKIIKNEISQKE